MKRTQRDIDFDRAKLEFEGMFLGIEKKYQLTASELFLILSSSMRMISSLCVRDERREKDDNEGQ